MNPKPKPAAPETPPKPRSSPEAWLAVARAFRRAAAEMDDPKLIEHAEALEAAARKARVTGPG